MAYKPKVLTVSEGGSGVNSFTAYGPITAGNTSTNPFLSIAPGNLGDVLTSQGPSAPAQMLPYSGGTSKGYVWQIQMQGSFSPADSTTYYLYMQGNGDTTSSAISRFFVPAACTIKSVYGAANFSAGSAENSTLEIFVNSTTSTSITSTLQITSSLVTFNNSSLSVALVVGDYFEIRWITPAWVTNPTFGGFSMEIQAN